MTPDIAIDLVSESLNLTMLLVVVLVLPGLVMGLVVALFQAATQINEMTLTFIPKLVALFVTMVLVGPWMINTFVDYMREVFQGIPALAH